MTHDTAQYRETIIRNILDMETLLANNSRETLYAIIPNEVTHYETHHKKYGIGRATV